MHGSDQLFHLTNSSTGSNVTSGDDAGSSANIGNNVPVGSSERQ